MIGIPVVVVCYLLVNMSFFVVLSHQEITSAEAVALVCPPYCVHDIKATKGLLCLDMGLSSPWYSWSGGYAHRHSNIHVWSSKHDDVHCCEVCA